jgi:OOP family OmpA-OmpF porin
VTRPIAIAAIVAAATLLAGCGGDGPTPPPPPPPLSCPISAAAAVTISVGDRSTSAAPEIPSVVSEPMQAAARAGAPITVIRSDGAPEAVYSGAFRSDAANGVARKSEQNAFVATLFAAFGDPVRARVAQADPLRALALAADSTPSGGTIVMADSGLQTVSPLRFEDAGGRLLDSDPKEIVTYLKTAGRTTLIPALSGKSVIFLGLGRTAGAQPPPDQDVRTRLKDIWTAIAQAGGARCVEARPEPPAGTVTRAGRPAVAVVPLPHPPPPPVTCGTVVLADRDVSFVADQDTFNDETAARQTIARVADAMRGRVSTALLTGTTANVNGLDGQVALSQRRAEAVRRVLVSMGIAANRISTRGLGSRFPGYVQDHDAGGHLLPGPAAVNRRVIADLTCPRS